MRNGNVEALMKLLLNNYRLWSGPKPLAYMTTFKLHKNPVKLVLYNSPLTSEETEKQSKSHSRRSRIHICQYLPSKSLVVSAVPSMVPQSFKHGDGIYYPEPIPSAPLTDFLLELEVQVPLLPLPHSWSGEQHSSVWAQKPTEERKPIWAAQRYVHLTHLPSS